MRASRPRPTLPSPCPASTSASSPRSATARRRGARSTHSLCVRPPMRSTSSAAPTTKAGASFTITATPQNISNGALTGATGSPTLDSTKAPAVSGTQTLLLQSWNPGATSGTFIYNDVGSFSLPANAIYDAQYGNASGEAQDRTNGDCNPGSGTPYVPASQQYGRFRRQVRLRYRQRRLAQLRAFLPGPLRGFARGDAGMLGGRVQLHGTAVLDDLRVRWLHADQGARRRADLRDCAGAAVVYRGLHAARQRVVRRAERSRLDHRSDPLRIVDPERHRQSLRDDHAALQGCNVEYVDRGFVHRGSDDLLFRSTQGRHHDAGLDLGPIRLIERRRHGVGLRRLDADHSRRASPSCSTATPTRA